MKPKSMEEGHEITTWKARPFVLLLAGFSVLIVLADFVLGGLTARWSHHDWPPAGPVVPPQATPGWNDGPPQLQTDAALDLQQLRALEFEHLHTTRWSDISHAYASIPIERAMQILAQAQAENRLNQVLPTPKPATPIDLQNQKSTEAPHAP